MMSSLNYGGFVRYTAHRNIVDKLYDNESWDGEDIEDMSDGDLIKTVAELRKGAQESKSDLEYYFLNNKKEVTRYKKLFRTKMDFVLDLMKTDTIEWLEDLPVYNALITEIEKRKLTDYLNVVLEREEK